MDDRTAAIKIGNYVGKEADSLIMLKILKFNQSLRYQNCIKCIH